MMGWMWLSERRAAAGGAATDRSHERIVSSGRLSVLLRAIEANTRALAGSRRASRVAGRADRLAHATGAATSRPARAEREHGSDQTDQDNTLESQAA